MRRRRAAKMVEALIMGAAIRPRPDFVKVPTVVPGWSEGPDPEVRALEFFSPRTSGFDASHRPGMTPYLRSRGSIGRAPAGNHCLPSPRCRAPGTDSGSPEPA